MSYPVISADSHTIELSRVYSDYIDKAWLDKAPRLVEADNTLWSVIDGMPRVKVAANFGPGLDPKDRESVTRIDQLSASGWDPSRRAADQDRDGVSAEVIYPSVGMIICNHPNLDYRAACFSAYNRWLGEYTSFAPQRLIGIGQTAMRTPQEGIADLHSIKALGLRGVMLPGMPGVEDYYSPIYDEFWQTCIELKLPPSFHIIAVGGGANSAADAAAIRGPKLGQVMGILRGIQDLLSALVFGGTFERNPTLKITCVEGDAGWVPHYLHRIDRGYREHSYRFAQHQLAKLPSEYFKEQVYLTFQEDVTAWQFADQMNWHRLMWANDFPHSDATWPNSRAVIAQHSAYVKPEQKRAILCDNVADLYDIDVESIPSRVLN